MSKAKIFILAWGVLLVVVAITFYAYITLGKPRVGKLNLFGTQSEQSVSSSEPEGWFGKLTSDKNLYPAKEAQFSIELGESEKSYVITIENLSQNSLDALEQNLKNSNIAYFATKTKDGFKVEVESTNKDKMNAKLEIIKGFNLSTKN